MTSNANQLGQAVSPYLQQHRDNPVHWREWSPAVLAEAERDNKPILLSIGYAACHWCHVMAHESFENEATAAVMNRLFVNVKVDREERPDIDHFYMTALQAMGEQGGWPMTMFLTPKGEPFYGGTYYPPEPMHGRPGFVQLLEAVSDAWINRRDSLQGNADQLSAHLAGFLSKGGENALPDDAFSETANRIRDMIDPDLGGMRGAPKFPNAPYLELLARSGFPDGDARHRDAFLLTLRSLCEGGIYDHLGGGLHRYSTDARWLVPHFEKMLYDNAQFLRHLVWGFRTTGDQLLHQRIGETVAWLDREMRVSGGGLSASLDADSADAHGHMEEGAFYVWSEDEIDAVLPAGADRDAFKAAYDVTPAGNWEGRTILNRLAQPGQAEPKDFGEARIRLLQARESRARPGRDDKVLADWNGLAIRALAEVAATLQHPEALRLARDAHGFVMREMMRDGRLHHAAREGRLSGVAFAGDYGAMIAASAQLFIATLDAGFLDDARRLAEALECWHGDGEGVHYMTAVDAADVPMRLRGDPDDAVPGSTALVLEGLVLLAQVTGEPELMARAEQAGRAARTRIGDAPVAYPGLLSALDRLAHGSELGLFGFRSNPGFEDMRAAVESELDLNRVDFVSNDPTLLPETLALSALQPPRFPAATLCRNQTCLPLMFDAASLETALRS